MKFKDLESENVCAGAIREAIDNADIIADVQRRLAIALDSLDTCLVTIQANALQGATA